VQRDIYLWQMDPADLKWLGDDPWLRYLDGKNPDHPVRALEADFDRLRRRMEMMRQDHRSPDTRPSDGAHGFIPISTETLVNQMLGGNDPGKDGNILHCRLRYFDPRRRRAGLPEDVAALVEKIRPNDVVLTLVNTSAIHAREIVIQAGAYAEHQCLSVEWGGKKAAVDATHFTVRMAPGSGGTMTITMKRYANQPIAAFPWDR
jgi:hypothetical protein